VTDREQLAHINRFWLPLCALMLTINAVCVLFVHDWVNWALLAGQVAFVGGFLWLRRALQRRIADAESDQ
jgi:hypothetical protein